MAIPKKGARKIAVDGSAYIWRVGREAYHFSEDVSSLTVAVERCERKGRTLMVDIWYRHYAPGDFSLKLTPSAVARFIRQALAKGWQADLPGKPFAMRVGLDAAGNDLPAGVPS